MVQGLRGERSGEGEEMKIVLPVAVELPFGQRCDSCEELLPPEQFIFVYNKERLGFHEESWFCKLSCLKREV
jgi:hypothetical protein